MWSTMRGARYLSQSTSQWANLSAPKRIGATVKPMRRSQNAWYAGSWRSAWVSTPTGSTDGRAATEVVMVCLLHLYTTVVSPLEGLPGPSHGENVEKGA